MFFSMLPRPGRSVLSSCLGWPLQGVVRGPFVADVALGGGVLVSRRPGLAGGAAPPSLAVHAVPLP